MKPLIIISKDFKHTKLLEQFGELILFETENIVYKEISNHPDLFINLIDNLLFYNESLPKYYEKTIINKVFNRYNIIKLNSNLGSRYPETARLCFSYNHNIFIHNLKITDKNIINFLKDKTIIDVKQGYARCSTLILKNIILTSDSGIKKILDLHKINNLYINPKNIKLKNFKNGFFGGCCGLYKDYLFISGSLKYFEEREEIINLTKKDYEIIELSNDYPIDIGSIIFI